MTTPARSIRSPRTGRARRAAEVARAGFTLIELLVVIAVILVLLTVAITVGSKVISGQRGSLTEGTLRTLDRMLTEHKMDTDVFPIFKVEQYDAVPPFDLTPFASSASVPCNDEASRIVTYDGEQYPALPDAGVFLRQVEGVGQIQSLLSGLPQDTFASVICASSDLPFQRIVDGWERPILYVHPDNALARALYGDTPSGRPYFMSAGADGRYGLTDEPLQAVDFETDEAEAALEDNLHSVTPGAYKEGLGVR